MGGEEAGSISAIFHLSNTPLVTGIWGLEPFSLISHPGWGRCREHYSLVAGYAWDTAAPAPHHEIRGAEDLSHTALKQKPPRARERQRSGNRCVSRENLGPVRGGAASEPQVVGATRPPERGWLTWHRAAQQEARHQAPPTNQ